MFIEDNNGYIFFPLRGNRIKVNIGGKTLIYLVAFEPKNMSEISNIHIVLPGDFVSDDVVDRVNHQDVIKNQNLQNEYDNNYFPNLSLDEYNRLNSISMVSAICIGWSDDSYDLDGNSWKASFRDLTDEGKKLYYTIKKLHNNKEVRILTFNNI